MGSVNEIRFSFLCKSLDILKNSLLTSKSKSSPPKDAPMNVNIL